MTSNYGLFCPQHQELLCLDGMTFDQAVLWLHRMPELVVFCKGATKFPNLISFLAYPASIDVLVDFVLTHGECACVVANEHGDTFPMPNCVTPEA